MGEALLEQVLAEFAQTRDSRGPLIESLVFSAVPIPWKSHPFLKRNLQKEKISEKEGDMKRISLGAGPALTNL